MDRNTSPSWKVICFQTSVMVCESFSVALLMMKNLGCGDPIWALKKKIKREVYKVWGNNPLIHFQQKSPFSFQIQYASERTLLSIKREYGTFEPWVIIITPLAYSSPPPFFYLHWHSCWVFQSFLRIRNVHVFWFISWVERCSPLIHSELGHPTVVFAFVLSSSRLSSVLSGSPGT